MVETTAEDDKDIPSPFELSRATQDDLPVVWKIIKEDAEWLAKQGLSHWKKYYTEEMVSRMIQKKKVYIGMSGDQPIGTITFDSKPPKYYSEPGYAELFTNPDEQATYLNAVAVLPNEHKKGYASKMLQFVEREAKKNGDSWIRLDCRTEVLGLVQFYERRGFSKLGDHPIDEGEDGTYWLMEKQL